jgi:hypothetical protein
MPDIEAGAQYFEFYKEDITVMRVPEKKSPTPVEIEQAAKQYYPTRWWQAVETHPEKGVMLLAETSDPEDFKQLEILGKPNVKIFRLFEKREQNWVEEVPPQ